MYSQRNEEAAILRVCADAPRRKALDIGAYHPTVFSNSRALIELGWGAVLVEPSPGPLRNLVIEYEQQNIKFKDVTVIAAAVGIEPGIVSMRITDDAVSTSSAAKAEEWKDRGGYIGTLHVPVLTIPYLLNRFGAFDFVSIDAEGESVSLLKALLATEMMPACICCEYDDKLAEAQMAAQVRGYRTIYTSNENIVLQLVGA